VLWLLVRDPLVRLVRPFPSGPDVDLAGLPVAVGEDGLTHRLRLLGTHLLIVGATGSGKGSVLWSLIHALAPAVQAGTVALWVVDPKGGMELAGGRGLFARFCHGAPDEQQDGRTAVDVVSHELAYAEVLEDAVCVMRNRQAALRGVTRLHTPTPREPLIVIVVDELAALTAYVTDRDAKRRIAAALALLLSQGRAVGVSVVAALQDPRKEVLPARDLVPTRVALRLTDDQQVDMVLGDGARRRGAAADRIPDQLPGVGYLTVDGLSEPARVRFTYLTDPDIAVMAATHPATVGTAGDRAAGEERGAA
jgi:S-DNA-T family DNA segregation ATPase FtsK/SpoIIIE